LQSPDVVDKFLREGAAPKRTTPAQFSAFVRDEIAKWSKVVKFAKVEPL
jgi:tripartite-type tricarboxylate transporter receptor subunit TctC